MLTDTQKARIRLYLGYPDMLRDRHTRLESVLNKLSPEAEVLVLDILQKLDTIEGYIFDTVNTAGIRRVDEVWFENGYSRSTQVRKNAKAYIARLSIITGVPIYSDVMGTEGYLGDSFSSGLGNRPPRGGGFFGLG